MPVPLACAQPGSRAGRFGIPALCCFATLFGCAGTPAGPPPGSGAAQTPRVELGDSEVSGASAAELIERATQGAADAALARLVLAEQAIAGEPLVAGNAVQLLIDGPSTFDSMFEAISAARHYVLVESFIVADDEVGQRLESALTDAISRGVRVCLLVDAVGSFNTEEAYFEELSRRGIEARKYAPVDPTESLKLWRLNNRNHRKLLVVDGRVAFLGGVNFADVYSSPSSISPGPDEGMEEGWRDTHARIEGPVVSKFQAAFERNWAETGAPLELPDDAGAEADPAGPHLVRPLVSEGGDSEEFDIYYSYLNAVRSARERIWLTHAYFSPNEEFLDAVTDAASAGVDVQLLLPGFIDFGPVFHASRSNYHRLLEAGVRIFERNDALLHAKTAVVDGVWSTVGSANLDMRSFVHNDEVNAVVIGRAFAKEMEAVFRADRDKAREIHIDEWAERPWHMKLREWFYKRFNYWL